MNEEVFNYLENLRVESGLSHQQISELSHVPAGTVSRYFSKNVKDPTFVTVASLTVALGGSVDEILGLTRKPEQPQTERPINCDTCRMINISRDAFTHAYNEIKDRQEVELARVKQYLQIKDKWLHAMFIYCVIITLMMAAVCIFK